MEAEQLVMASEIETLRRTVKDMGRLNVSRSARYLYHLERRAQDAEAALQEAEKLNSEYASRLENMSRLAGD